MSATTTTERPTIKDKETFFLTQIADLLRENTRGIEDALNELGQTRATLIVNFGAINGCGQSGIRVNEDRSTLTMMMDVLDQLINQPRPPKPDVKASLYSNCDEQTTPIRGSEIKKTGHHDAGAYAMCSNCGSYSYHPEALSNNYPCHCGKSGYWSGSFKKPTKESRWSETRPDPN